MDDHRHSRLLASHRDPRRQHQHQLCTFYAHRHRRHQPRMVGMCMNLSTWVQSLAHAHLRYYGLKWLGRPFMGPGFDMEAFEAEVAFRKSTMMEGIEVVERAMSTGAIAAAAAAALATPRCALCSATFVPVSVYGNFHQLPNSTTLRASRGLGSPRASARVSHERASGQREAPGSHGGSGHAAEDRGPWGRESDNFNGNVSSKYQVL